MELNSAELAQLVRDALIAPPWVTRIESQTGQVVEIEREPEDGIQVRLLLPESEYGAEDWLAIVVEPVEVKPALYPSSVPFVPAVGAIVTSVGGTVTVVWRPSADPTCALPTPEAAEALTEVTDRLRVIEEETRRGDSASRAQAADRVKAVFEFLAPDKRRRLEELWESLRVEATVEAEFSRIFDTAAAASRNEGWEVISEEQKDSPACVRKTTFKRGPFARTLFMLAMSGGSVLLKQQPWESMPAA